MYSNPSPLSSRRVGQERRCTSSFLSVAKKLSATALSKQSPLEPIERAMPASRAAWPKARETYWADSSGRRNTSMRGVAMGRPAGWMTALTGRSAMKSPGKPSHRREGERDFWREIALGPTRAAALTVGGSPAVGTRWFRQRGGMPLIDLAPLSGRYLSFSERDEIAV